MNHERKLQVFISSTYTDLREERQAAVEAVLDAGHIPAGMELFSAEDKSQMRVIERWIDESDAYMLILGARYGSIEPQTQRSYTHLEYEYASKKGKPLFAVVIEETFLEAYRKDKTKRIGSRAMKEEHPDKLENFRKLVCSNMIGRWENTDQIKIAIMKSLKAISTRADLVGWIPGSAGIKQGVDVRRRKRFHEKFDQRFADARSLDLHGYTLGGIWTSHMGLLKEKAESGCKIRILLLDPLSSTPEVVSCLTEAQRRLANDIQSSIDSFSDLLKWESVQLKYSSAPTPYGLVIGDSGESCGVLDVDLYAYRVSASERPKLVIRKDTDEDLFAFFVDQFENLWTDGRSHKEPEQP